MRMNLRLELTRLLDSSIKEEIYDIKRSYNEFRNHINISRFSDDFVTRLSGLIEAERSIKNCVIMIRTLLDKNNNNYIKQFSSEYEELINNLGAVDMELNSLGESAIGSVQTTNQYSIDKTEPVKMKQYRNLLLLMANNLVIYPLKRGYYKFINSKKDEKKYPKNRELLCFYIFNELSNNMESMGAYMKMQRLKPSMIDLSTLRSAIKSPKSLEEKSKDESGEDSDLEQSQEKEIEYDINKLEESKFDEQEIDINKLIEGVE